MSEGHRLAALVSAVGGRLLRGNPELVVARMATPEAAGPDTLCFIEAPRALSRLRRSAAGAALIPSGASGKARPPDRPLLEDLPDSLALVEVKSPRLAAARLSPWFERAPLLSPGVHPSAIVDPEAELGPEVAIGPLCYVGRRARLGARVVLHAGAQVLDEAVVGEDTVLFSRAIVSARCEVGARCRLLPGSVVGSEGFGFVADRGPFGLEHVAMPQLGRAVLEDEVRIGACSLVDRGTFEDTRVGRGSKIDNLVQIAHNVTIGPGCLVVAQAGIAGSARLEAGAVIAAQAGVAGHRTVGEGATVGGQSGVVRDVPPGAFVLGTPAVRKTHFFRQAGLVDRSRDLARRLARLERAALGVGSPGRPPEKPEVDARVGWSREERSTMSRNEALRREVDRFMDKVRARDSGAPEFHQAVREVVESVMPVVLDHEAYRDHKILERMTEPDRVVSFRVVYEDDRGEIHVHRAWRVQFSQALGPYKGGFRFHPSVTEGTLKFLGFEQVFKNSLTGLSLGAGKGGANFDPKGKSDREVMRFCQALMRELFRHLGPDTDVPAGDIGVSAREVGYLFGSYKRLKNTFTGTFTGKGLAFGGSLLRLEATGYGTVHFACHMLEHRGESITGRRALVSGSGNVAIYAMQKLEQLGALAVTASDSSGFVYDEDGIVGEKLEFLRDLKEHRRGRIQAYAERFPRARFHPGARPWSVPGDLAIPCATQNELDGSDAEILVKNGVQAVVEGANMPCTTDAVAVLRAHRVPFGPGKAANAGGVATSGLEMSQNAARVRWTREEVDLRLRAIMTEIHRKCVDHGRHDDGFVDYVQGANLAGFHRVAEAMLAYGLD